MIPPMFAILAVLTIQEPRETLMRWNVSAEERTKALRQAAEGSGVTAVEELVAAIQEADAADADALGELAGLLVSWDAGELRKARESLRKLAAEARRPAARQAALASWMVADGAFDSPYLSVRDSNAGMRDFLHAVPLVGDENVRRPMFDRVRRLMYLLPTTLEDPPGAGAPGLRVELYPVPSDGATPARIRQGAPLNEGRAECIDLAGLPFATRPGTAVVFSGTLHAPADGDYAFRLAGSGVGALYVAGRLVVRSDRGEFVERSVRLALGPQPVLAVHGVARETGKLELAWRPPGQVQAGPIPKHLFRTLEWVPLRELAITTLRSIPGNDEDKFRFLTDLARSGDYAWPAVLALDTVPVEIWPEDRTAHLAGEVTALAARSAEDPMAAAALEDASTFGRKLEPRLPEGRREAFRTALAEAIDPKKGGVGRRLFLKTCVRCHEPDGKGLVNEIPPLAGSPWIKGEPNLMIKVVLHGVMGGITIDGEGFVGEMRGFGERFSEAEIAAVISYVREVFGGGAGAVTVQTVSRVRNDTKGQRGPWKAENLLLTHPLP